MLSLLVLEKNCVSLLRLLNFSSMFLSFLAHRSCLCFVRFIPKYDIFLELLVGLDYFFSSFQLFIANRYLNYLIFNSFQWWKFIISQFYSSEAQHKSCETKIKVTGGLHFFLKALQNHLYLFQTQEVNHFPWVGPLPPSSKPAVAVIFSPCIFPFISFWS